MKVLQEQVPYEPSTFHFRKQGKSRILNATGTLPKSWPLRDGPICPGRVPKRATQPGKASSVIDPD
jgi:hypothetical protein